MPIAYYNCSKIPQAGSDVASWQKRRKLPPINSGAGGRLSFSQRSALHKDRHNQPNHTISQSAKPHYITISQTTLHHTHPHHNTPTHYHNHHSNTHSHTKSHYTTPPTPPPQPFNPPPPPPHPFTPQWIPRQTRPSKGRYVWLNPIRFF